MLATARLGLRRNFSTIGNVTRLSPNFSKIVQSKYYTSPKFEKAHQAVQREKPVLTPAVHKEMDARKRVLIVTGSTASGKTNISMEFALKNTLGPNGTPKNCEIISCDSVQMYRQLKIGSNKASEEMMRLVPHHLVDILDTDDTSDRLEKDFVDRARQLVTEITERGNIPIVVGGAAFYLHSLMYASDNAPPRSDIAVRNAIMLELKKVGWDETVRRLSAVDPASAKRINKNDYSRAARALEVYRGTGKPFSSYLNRPPPKLFGEQEMDQQSLDALAKLPLNFDFRGAVLVCNKLQLYYSIAKRCEEMIENGLFEETLDLLLRGLLKRGSPAARSIGYEEAVSFLLDTDPPCSSTAFFDFLSKFKATTRQYAKHQLTWFRDEPTFSWIEVTDSFKEKLTEEQRQQHITEAVRHLERIYTCSNEEYMTQFAWGETTEMLREYSRGEHDRLFTQKVKNRLASTNIDHTSKEYSEIISTEVRMYNAAIFQFMEQAIIYKNIPILQSRLSKIDVLLEHIKKLKKQLAMAPKPIK